MKVFISWSGEHSKAVANALAKLIKVVIQSAKPWVSDKEIQAGDRWSSVIAAGLVDAQFGIICITPTNQTSPWLNFEAGAISKNVEESKIVPYLHGLTFPNMINGPLSQFQAKEANKEDTFKVLSAINSALLQPLENETLQEAFNSYWTTFEETIKSIDLTPRDKELSVRSSEDKLDELIEVMKGRDGKNGEKLNYIATNLKYLSIALNNQGSLFDPEKILPTFMQLLTMQARAFVKAATANLHKDEKVLVLEYDNKRQFHYKQAVKLHNYLRDILDMVTAGTYKLVIVNPDEEYLDSRATAEE